MKQSLYIYDGDNIVINDSTWFDKDYFERAVEKIKTNKYLELGRCTMSEPHCWGYMKGKCYSLRLYNKALNETQIKDTYDATTTFHKNPILTK